jgi:hypothetical protein
MSRGATRLRIPVDITTAQFKIEQSRACAALLYWCFFQRTAISAAEAAAGGPFVDAEDFKC